ncbi:LamB/YcsF family protein [Plastorhodobacter daqingensis]|uniref:LamB/YcsF family protein n=1 Tax=Plastorhodobacter daqingensis TaxID=1387281 RepID=A0ABW2ULE8_9RHOB
MFDRLSAANIPCGSHAADPVAMRRAIRMARATRILVTENGIAVAPFA